MDCDYKDDGGATAELNVNNNLNSKSLFLKSSVSLLEANNNGECSITEESDAHELSNGIAEYKHIEKYSPGEISLSTITNQLNGDLAVEDKHSEKNSTCVNSLCTITNQINKDLAVWKDKSECKSPLEGILQSPMSNQLSIAKEGSLVEKGSSTIQLDKCTSLVSDSEHLVDQTDISDNGSASETVDCIEKLAENVETCTDTISSDEIAKAESIPSSSDILEVLDESISEEEVYLEVDDVDEQESDISVEKQDEAESGKDIDLKSHNICDNVSGSLKTNDLVNESSKNGNDVSMSSDISAEKSFDVGIPESEVFEEVEGLSENGSIDLKISDEKQDAPLLEKSSEKLSSLNSDGESPQIESKSKATISVKKEVQSEMEKNLFEDESAMSETSEMKSLESNVADEENSTEHSTVIETSENVKTIESNFAADENSSKNSTDMETSKMVETVKSNIAAEDNSLTNVTDMDSSENAKTVELDIPAEENSSTNVTDMDSSENAKTVELDIPAEENSSTNVTDMDSSENMKTVESNIATERNLTKTAADMDTSENAKTVELNIATEESSSKNVADMDISENAKTVESNTATETNSSKNSEDMDTSENATTVISNIATEGIDSSKNAAEMDTSENAKAVESNIATEGNFLRMATDIESIENTKTLESDIASERNSSRNVSDVEMSESIKAVESNIAVEKNSLKNATDMETIENAKTLESDIATEGKSTKSATDMENNENAKSVESDIADEGNSSKNASDVEISESTKAVESVSAAEGKSSKNASDVEISEGAKAVESNIAAENSSKNATDLETSEKSNDLDDFLVLSDIEWSDDDDASDKQKTKVEKDKCTQSEKKCSKENENPKNTVDENPGTSSDGDDFDLDDVIEEFAKEEENKVVKLSDDELDDLVEEFVEAECSSASIEKNKESESKNVPSESDDEMELLIEDFKAVDSDNDCFIVQDSDNVVVINDDDKDSQSKNKKSKPNDSQSCTGINSTDSRDKVKSDAISSSHKEPEASDKDSKNDKTVVRENEVKNKVTNPEKNKTFEIGSFKSEIFDNEVEGNKQDNDSVILEIVNKGDSEDTKNKGSISIVSALPLSQRLPGKKVTLECRTDGVYLKKFHNTDNDGSDCTNENGAKRSTNLSTDTSNNRLNSHDKQHSSLNQSVFNHWINNSSSSLNHKVSVDQSVTKGSNSGSLEEEQCIDDMLNKVCSSNAGNSTNNEECRSSADGKESKKVNASIQLEEKQIASQNGEVKSLGSLCHDTLEESKKRKLDVLDIKPDEPQKKMKAEVNGVDTDMDTSPSSISHVDTSVRKKVLQHFKEAFPSKVQLKKSWLGKLSKRLCQETILEEYQQKIAHQNNLIKNLEDKLQALEDELCYSQSQATTFLSVQQELFQKHHFTPQTAVRTVAVNVKIFRECDVAQPVPQPIPLPVIPKVEVPTHTTEIHGSTPVSSTPPIKVQVPQQKIPIPVQQTAVPQRAASARFVSNPMQPRAVITTSQRFVPAAPNVTMMKKEVPTTVMSNSQPVRPRSYLAEKSPPTTKTSSQVIDLTDEELSNKKLLPASSTLVSIASNSVPKVSLPGLQNNQNVLLPLNGLFQMLPASAPNTAQFSLSNPVQVQQVSRQAFVPNLPPNLLGPRTVAYIIPSNSNQINTIGRNSLPVSNFVPGTNQRLQTLIVRVTNPGQVPSSMGTLINSSARMPVLPQGLRATTVSKNSPISSSASDLVLFPRQPKHPAPFPALPEYRPNPQLKALPPKPSLKGSKAPNGIILSWNMSLLSLHAEISNYQLFAYQEAPGPVNASLWKKVGDVKALPLPMACTLTQFVDGNRYYFTVRAVDVHNRFGPYSDAVSILFSDAKDNSKSLNK